MKPNNIYNSIQTDVFLKCSNIMFLTEFTNILTKTNVMVDDLIAWFLVTTTQYLGRNSLDKDDNI